MARPKKNSENVNGEPTTPPSPKVKVDYAAEVERMNAAGMPQFGKALASFVSQVDDATKALKVAKKTLRKAHKNIVGAMDTVAANG